MWFLASVIDPGGVASFTRSCTIPEHRAVLISPSGVLNDFPCPDPSFQPAPGQSLYDFLRAGAAEIVDAVNGLTVTIDGQDVADPFAFRVVSPRLFEVNGDDSLATVLDGCIVGHPQPAVSDGYFLMLKPLARGAHTLVIRATDTHGTDVTITWHLTVARGR